MGRARLQARLRSASEPTHANASNNSMPWCGGQMSPMPFVSILITILLVLTGVGYLSMGVTTWRADVRSQMRRRYLWACVCLAVWSISFGLMTSAGEEPLARTFWTFGFICSHLFFPAWTHFLTDLADYRPRHLSWVAGGIYAVSLTLITACIASGDVIFAQTPYGTQFSYGHSTCFQVLFFFSGLVLSTNLFLQLRWLRRSQFRRQKIQSLIFIFGTVLVSPPGLALDFFVPSFLDATVVPLTTVPVLLVSAQLYLSMRTTHSLSVTVQNVSESLFRSVKLPVLVADHRNQIVLANASAAAFLEPLFGVVLGRDIADLVRVAGKRPERAYFDSNFEGAVVTVPSPAGEHTCDMVLTVIRDTYGDLLSKVVVLRDMTELQKTLDDLRISRDVAERASGAKSDFLSRMSHELRTPMNGIIGMTRIGRATSDVAKLQHCLARIDDASKQLLGLINDILDMSKIEANKLELVSEPFNLEEMLMRLCNVIAVKAEEKEIDLFVNLDRAVPRRVIGDELRLSQVISNLLSNAVKFSPNRGRIRLNVVRQAAADRMSQVQFEVIDNGIGISEEQRSRLFSAFEQAAGDTARRFGGTGLGLAIAQRIVQMMDGQIQVESKVGEGTRFFFCVPLHHADRVTNPKETMPAIYQGLRMLVADDSLEVREHVGKALTAAGIRADFVRGGREAIAAAKRARHAADPYQLLLVEQTMEGLDGMSTSRQINESVGPTPAILMTSNTNWTGIEGEAAVSGVVRSVLKPIFHTALLEAIREVLASRGLVQESMGAPVSEPAHTYAGCRVLLAEDIELNRLIVTELLSALKLQIECVGDGAEAVRVFRENPGRYDLVLMDLQMPVLNGLDATRQIRQLGTPEAARVPIIAMTANAFTDDMEACREAGMVDHLSKPVDVDEMYAKITRQLIGKEDRPTALPTTHEPSSEER